MKKILKTIFPSGMILATLTSFCGCSNNTSGEVTITIDSGLGYFVEDYTNLGYFYEEPHRISTNITIERGTRFCDLSFKLPAMPTDDSYEKDYFLPVYWTVGNNKINYNYHFYSDTTVTAQYFTSYSCGRQEMLSTVIHSVIGAAKRCVLYGKEIPELLFEWPFQVYDSLTSLYTCCGFAKMLSAAADTIGETNKGIEYFNAMVDAASQLNNKCGQNLASMAYQSIVGVLKRRFMDNIPVTSWWINFINKIADIAQQCGEEKSLYFSQAMSSLADEIGEARKEEDSQQTDVNEFIFNAFLVAKDLETTVEICKTTTNFISSLKRAYVYGQGDPTEIIAQYKETVNEILAR